MRLSITGPRTRLTERMRTYIGRRVHFRLSRFGARVTQVRVRLADVPRDGGRGDRSCTVTVTVDGAEPMVAEHSDARMTLAVDHAVARAARHVARTVELLDGRLAGPTTRARPHDGGNG